jgi:hypothetical protein
VIAAVVVNVFGDRAWEWVTKSTQPCTPVLFTYKNPPDCKQ